MALKGLLQMPADRGGATHPDAYWRLQIAGGASTYVVTAYVYLSRQHRETNEGDPIALVPLGFSVDVDPDQAPMPQIYPVFNADPRFEHLVNDVPEEPA